LPSAIPIGIPIIGCMARTTNILSSADCVTMSSTTPSEDEDDADDRHRFHTPSSDVTSPKYDVVDNLNEQLTTNNNNNNNDNNDTDSTTTDDLSYTIQTTTTTTTTNDPQAHTYLNLSTSSSETSLARPLLIQPHQSLPLYTNEIPDETILTSSASSTTSSSSTTGSISASYRSYMALYLTDMLIAAFIITPFVNIHWRGAWDLLDIHLLPEHPIISALISLSISLFMLYSIYISQNSFQSFYEKHRHNILGQIMTRMYTLIIAFAYINQWRGLWNLLDMTSNVWYHLVIETLVSILFLALTRSIYNLNSAPFLIGIDTESYFLLGSKYTISSKHFLQYTFDFILGEVVEAPLLIIAWRGLYNLSDLYIYPERARLSMTISFISGYLLFFVLALIQIPIVRCLIKRPHRRIHSFVSNIFHLIAFVSVGQIWRSLWIMCEQFLNIPGHHQLTLWLCYAVSFIVLTCGLAACSLNGPGGSKDGHTNEGPMLLFKFDYFSTLLKRQSAHFKVNSDSSLGSDLSSSETLIVSDRPYRFDPP
jgi:hypothetical protein